MGVRDGLGAQFDVLACGAAGAGGVGSALSDDAGARIAAGGDAAGSERREGAGDAGTAASPDVVGPSAGCAWTAAWLTARGRQLQGCREVLVDPSWRGELSWRDRRGQQKAGHRPDLAWRVDGGRVAIEVELARKSTPRLEAILGLHARWRAARHTSGVIYICADEDGCDRIRQLGAARGLSAERGGGLRVETLDRIEQQAREAARPPGAVGDV